MDTQAFLNSLFEAAVEAALPRGKFAGKLPEPPTGRTIVIGAGKAAASMAQAFEEAWPYPLEGLVVTRYGHRVPTRTIEVVEAAHPVPDQAGLDTSRRILDLARSAGPDDLVVCLISGGASSLLCQPCDGVTLADKQAVNKALLRSGAPIGAMNQVRKALSAIKGGRLGEAAAPAQLMTDIISDVPGDDPASIGSGPTIPGRPTPATVRAILAQYDIAVPPHVAAAIEINWREPSARVGAVNLLSSPKLSLDAAARVARAAGVTPIILGDAIEGEAREAAIVMAGIARSVALHGEPAKRPCVLLSGGETTVTVRGQGRGGRNAEFLLSLALALDGLPGVAAIACDTDGIDGSEDNAGAWFDERLMRDAEAVPLDLKAHLANNDAYTAFATLDRLVMTGPTMTNVNDFRAIFIE